MQEVFVAGATGVLGRRVVAGLVAPGFGVTGVARRPANVNGRPAATLWFGRQFALLALDVRGDQIQELHWIMNPDKLRYLRRQLLGASDAPVGLGEPSTVPPR
jgi:nucleoside-diphosphate-sugar epimerase